MEGDNLEQIWLQLNTVEGKLLLNVTYRPPDFNEFWDVFDINLETVKQANPSVKYYAIFGDLNGDFNTVDGRKLKDLCVSHHFHYLINEPTRITATTSTCLDQIFKD